MTTAAPPVKRRRTRWAQAEEQDATAKAIVLFPDKVVLSNGMQVSCGQLGSVERVDLHAVHSRHATLLCRHALQVVIPPAISGRGDQEVLHLHRQVPAATWISGLLLAGRPSLPPDAWQHAGDRSAALRHRIHAALPTGRDNCSCGWPGLLAPLPGSLLAQCFLPPKKRLPAVERRESQVAERHH